MKIFSLLFVLAQLPASAFAGDAEGCKDSPLLARFPGAVIAVCTDKADDFVDLPASKSFEGEYHFTRYTLSGNAASRAQIYRNLKTALANAGYSFPWDTSASAGNFLAHSGKNWILEEVGDNGYKQTIGIEVKLAQVVKANANGHYGSIAEVAVSGSDAAGCEDSPLVTRFPKSIIVSCGDKADARTELPVGKEHKAIEGEQHFTKYNFPPSSSKAQVYRNLKTALENAGFTIAYDGSASVGVLTAHSGKNWILEEIAESSPYYSQTVVVQTALTQEVTANADAIYGDLAKNGHSAVYGILFDTGKADIKPSSAAALKEIVKVLKKMPTIKIYIVGHTDDVGDVTSNLDLSRRRAASVVHSLVTEYGISPGMLDSFGAGPYAPVATNDKEVGGRALNRRVELVKQ